MTVLLLLLLFYFYLKKKNRNDFRCRMFCFISYIFGMSSVIVVAVALESSMGIIVVIYIERDE